MKAKVGDTVTWAYPVTYHREFLGYVEQDGKVLCKFDGGASIWAKPPHLVPLDVVESPQNLEVGKVGTFTKRHPETGYVVETWDHSTTLEVVPARYMDFEHPRAWAKLIDAQFLLEIEGKPVG